MGLGVTRDSELVKKTGATVAPQVRLTRIPSVFTQCIVVCKDDGVKILNVIMQIIG